MFNRPIVKVGAAVLLLAVVLIVLGVNFVPQIYALSSSRQTSLEAVKQARSDYVDERYPRAIVPKLSLAGSDWIERHPVTPTISPSTTGSDWIERHPSLYFVGSDWIERHPVQP